MNRSYKPVAKVLNLHFKLSALGFQSEGPWSVQWLLVSVFALALLH